MTCTKIPAPLDTDERDLSHHNKLIHTTIGMAWVNPNEMRRCASSPQKAKSILEMKSSLNLQELSRMFRSGYHAWEHKCPRIGGCLLEIGMDNCCCIKGTCD